MNGKIDRKLWVGIGISFFFLVLLFRKIDFNKLLSSLHEMDYRYLWPALMFTFASYLFRAVRWRFLLAPMKKIGLSALFSATIIGYMANNILPARLGEFIRAFVLGEREDLDKSEVFATLVIDRLFDGLTVLLILLITFFTVKLPPGMEQVQKGLVLGGYLTLGFYVAVVIFVLLLKKYTGGTLKLVASVMKPLPARFAEKIIPVLGSFIQGLRLSPRLADRVLLFISSAIIWTFAVYALDMVLRSFGIFLPITAAMFIMVFLVFAVMVPASPGYVGTYHAACVYGLMAFNIELEKALSVALLAHGVNFFPVILLGIYYLWRDKISISEARQKSAQQGELSE